MRHHTTMCSPHRAPPGRLRPQPRRWCLRVRATVPDRLPDGSNAQHYGLVTKPELNGTRCKARIVDTDVARYAAELADGSIIRVKCEYATPVRGSSGGGQRLGGHDRGHQGRVESITAGTGHPRVRRIGSFSREELRRIDWTGDRY